MLSAKYSDIRDKISSGDLIFFSGEDKISHLIEGVTSSPYSHVSICIWSMLIPEMEKRLCILESTTLNPSPDISGEFRKGTQSLLLSQKLDGCKNTSKAFWVPLKKCLTTEEKIKGAEWLFKRYADKSGYNYTACVVAGWGDLQNKFLKAILFPLFGFLGYFTKHHRVKKVFCSELATGFLIEVGRADPSINPISVVPGELIKFDCLSQPIEIIL